MVVSRGFTRLIREVNGPALDAKEINFQTYITSNCSATRRVARRRELEDTEAAASKFSLTRRYFSSPSPERDDYVTLRGGWAIIRRRSVRGVTSRLCQKFRSPRRVRSFRRRLEVGGVRGEHVDEASGLAAADYLGNW